MVDESEEQECSFRISGICIPVYGNHLFTVIIYITLIFLVCYSLRFKFSKNCSISFCKILIKLSSDVIVKFSLYRFQFPCFRHYSLATIQVNIN
jgi:hypothetical protein